MKAEMQYDCNVKQGDISEWSPCHIYIQQEQSCHDRKFHTSVTRSRRSLFKQGSGNLNDVNVCIMEFISLLMCIE